MNRLNWKYNLTITSKTFTKVKLLLTVLTNLWTQGPAEISNTFLYIIFIWNVEFIFVNDHMHNTSLCPIGHNVGGSCTNSSVLTSFSWINGMSLTRNYTLHCVISAVGTYLFIYKQTHINYIHMYLYIFLVDMQITCFNSLLHVRNKTN